MMLRHTAVVVALLALLAFQQTPARAADTVSAAAIENATSAADHSALADAYAKRAAEARAEAERHRAMAKSYKAGPKYHKVTSNRPGPSQHCDRLVEQNELLAKEADALAALHREMAKDAK